MFNLRKSGNEPEKKLHKSFYYKEADQGYVRASQKKRSTNDGETESWLLSYADAMTLLLVFFILLFSFSEINQTRFEEVQEGISTTLLQREAARPFQEVRQTVTETVISHELEDVITIEDTPLGLKLSFASSFIYELGSADIRQEMHEPLRIIAESIIPLEQQNYLIEVEGHTDDIPIQSAQYASNWELSAHRATNVVRLFESSGIPLDRMRAIAYGESRPLKPNRNNLGEQIAENQAVNRRVVVHIRRVSYSDL